MRQEDFERLYAEHAGPLFSFLAYRTGDRPLAEDLVADTFERAMRSRTPFDRRKGAEKTWLYAIAVNCLRDTQRRAAAAGRAGERDRALAAAQHQPDGLDLVDERHAIAAALNILSAEEREAISLRYGADLSVPEVAKVLNEPLQRVEGRVYRALRKLRSEMS